MYNDLERVKRINNLARNLKDNKIASTMSEALRMAEEMITPNASLRVSRPASDFKTAEIKPVASPVKDSSSYREVEEDLEESEEKVEIPEIIEADKEDHLSDVEEFIHESHEEFIANESEPEIIGELAEERKEDDSESLSGEEMEQVIEIKAEMNYEISEEPENKRIDGFDVIGETKQTFDDDIVKETDYSVEPVEEETIERVPAENFDEENKELLEPAEHHVEKQTHFDDYSTECSSDDEAPEIISSDEVENLRSEETKEDRPDIEVVDDFDITKDDRKLGDIIKDKDPDFVVEDDDEAPEENKEKSKKYGISGINDVLE